MKDEEEREANRVDESHCRGRAGHAEGWRYGEVSVQQAEVRAAEAQQRPVGSGGLERDERGSGDAERAWRRWETDDLVSWPDENISIPMIM